VRSRRTLSSRSIIELITNRYTLYENPDRTLLCRSLSLLASTNSHTFFISSQSAEDDSEVIFPKSAIYLRTHSFLSLSQLPSLPNMNWNREARGMRTTIFALSAVRLSMIPSKLTYRSTIMFCHISIIIIIVLFIRGGTVERIIIYEVFIIKTSSICT